MFSSSCAAGGYAVSLADLVKAPAGAGQPFVSPDLGVDNVTKSGYRVAVAASSGATIVTLAASTCNGSGADAVSSYLLVCDPTTARRHGHSLVRERHARHYLLHDNVGAAPQSDSGCIARRRIARQSPTLNAPIIFGDNQCSTAH